MSDKDVISATRGAGTEGRRPRYRGAPRHRGDDAPLAERHEDRQALHTADHFGAAGGSVVTELAVIRPTAQGLVLVETMAGVSVQQVLDATDAHLIVDAALRLV